MASTHIVILWLDGTFLRVTVVTIKGMNGHDVSGS
jgi:hypothetical protein